MHASNQDTNTHHAAHCAAKTPGTDQAMQCVPGRCNALSYLPSPVHRCSARVKAQDAGCCMCGVLVECTAPGCCMYRALVADEPSSESAPAPALLHSAPREASERPLASHTMHRHCFIHFLHCITLPASGRCRSLLRRMGACLIAYTAGNLGLHPAVSMPNLLQPVMYPHHQPETPALHLPLPVRPLDLCPPPHPSAWLHCFLVRKNQLSYVLWSTSTSFSWSPGHLAPSPV